MASEDLLSVCLSSSTRFTGTGCLPSWAPRTRQPYFVRLVAWSGNPQVRQVGGLGVPQLHLHSRPSIPNWIEIWTFVGCWASPWTRRRWSWTCGTVCHPAGSRLDHAAAWTTSASRPGILRYLTPFIISTFSSHSREPLPFQLKQAQATSLGNALQYSWWTWCCTCLSQWASCSAHWSWQTSTPLALVAEHHLPQLHNCPIPAALAEG